MKGIIFDIKEFAIYDGPGIRTTVFFKGCPLRCRWCHNPEGLSFEIQTSENKNGRRIIGVEYTSRDLACKLLQHKDVFEETGGGITFSGGEPLSQAAFLMDLIPRLKQTHITLDTSGFAPERTFLDVVQQVDFVLFDVKLTDNEQHIQYTGVENRQIVLNLKSLDEMNTPYHIRVPWIPGVTDTTDNIRGLARIAGNLKNCRKIELLPYNSAAGGKYESVGLVYNPGFDTGMAFRTDLSELNNLDIEVILNA